jgi:guanine deaminase
MPNRVGTSLSSRTLGGSDANFPLTLVRLFNPSIPPGGTAGTGPLDFFDPGSFHLSPEVVEKWWCLGDTRNRTGMWIQGGRLFG